MSFLICALPATRPSSQIAFYITQAAAVLLTLMAIAQLFTFEDFSEVLSVYLLPGGYPTTMILAAVLVTMEVLAVPCLLMMRLSPLMRLFSLACGWISCFIWLALGVQLIMQGDKVQNNGLLGATVSVHTGWLPLIATACIAAGLIVVLQITLGNVIRRRR